MTEIFSLLVSTSDLFSNRRLRFRTSAAFPKYRFPKPPSSNIGKSGYRLIELYSIGNRCGGFDASLC